MLAKWLHELLPSRNAMVMFILYHHKKIGESMLRIFFALLVVLAASEAKTLLFQSFEGGLLAPWQSVSVSSNHDWEAASYEGAKYAQANGYGADEASDDWLISPPINFGTLSGATLSFVTAKQYDGGSMQAVISVDYDGKSNPNNFTWTPLSAPYSTGNYNRVNSGAIDLSAYNTLGYVAFHYISTGTGPSEGAIWQVDDINISGEGTLALPFSAAIAASKQKALTTQSIEFSALVEQGEAPFSYSWSFSDGSNSSEQNVSHQFTSAGEYNVSVTVRDAADNYSVAAVIIVVDEAVDVAVPTKVGDLRIATFNASMNRSSYGELYADLLSKNSEQITNVAKIIQHVQPDIILINEFDYNGSANVERFIENYLNIAHGRLEAASYPYFFVAPSNTGIPSGEDFDNDGTTDSAGDGFGYGAFAGQYAMVILSKYPIDTEHVRTFQKFKWRDMPAPNFPFNEDGTPWYNTTELSLFRLSSKSHWDVPVHVGKQTLHLFASHPTPPVFDGPEDRNGKRNYDEIRLWKDYIDNAAYIYDDNGVYGGFGKDEPFVIMGDQNADPDEGDSYESAILQLIQHEKINSSYIPESDGAQEESGDRDDTSAFKLRVDYVLPSNCGIDVKQGGHFWPVRNDVKNPLISASDHRLVYLDVALNDSCNPKEEQTPQTPVPPEKKGDDKGGLNAVELPDILLFGMIALLLALYRKTMFTHAK